MEFDQKNDENTKHLNNDQAVGPDLDVFAIIKFILVVVLAVAIVVYALVWITQYNASSNKIEEPILESNSTADEEKSLTIQERIEIVESLNEEDVDSSVEVESSSNTQSDYEARRATINQMDEGSDGSDAKTSEDRQVLINSLSEE